MIDYKYTIPAFLFALVIFYMSSLPGQLLWGHGSTSEQIASNLCHIPAYGLLTLLWLKSFRRTSSKENDPTVKAFVAAGLVLFALSDEIHQSFVPGRSASWMDVGLNVMGILFGLGIHRILSRLCIMRARS